MRSTCVVIGALATNNPQIFLVFFQRPNFKETTGETTHGSWSRTSVSGRAGLACFLVKTAFQSQLSKNHLGVVSLITKTQMLGLEINSVALSPSGMELNQCPEDCSL